MVGDECTVDEGCVAGKCQSVSLRHGDPVFMGYPRLDESLRAVIECWGVINDATLGQRDKTGVEMVEALIHKTQRDHLNAQAFGQIPMCFQAAANAVACP